MTGLEKDVLQKGLCGDCDCKGFLAKLNYELKVEQKLNLEVFLEKLKM